MSRRFLAVALLLLPAGCASLQRTEPKAEPAAWSAPPLERAVSICNGRTGERVSLEAFLDALAKADVVFLGETHTDETTHRVELAVYEGLLARRDGDVVLAMEMFERDVQPALDEYLAGKIDEPTFLSRSRPWGNYHTAYRPMIERAKADGAPVVASNFPQPLRQRVAQEGPAAIAALQGDARRHAPAELLPNTAAYWRRADNAVRGHRGMMGGGGGDEQRLYATQSLWDNSMGESCALALDAHPGHLVLHVNGGFHSAYWDGTVHQLRLRRPQAKVLTVSITPAANPAVADVGGAPVADYVVFAETRATDVERGAWSVYVSRRHEYRLHMPKQASREKPVPLLIWLSDEGLTAADGLELWNERLGEQAAIAVIEPLYPQIQDDLSKGGRWFWPDTFMEDIDALIHAVEGSWAYILRHYPVDPQRVCLAGEGTGATVVAATALLTGRMNVDVVAFAPRQYAKIRDFPLPLPEDWGDEPPPERTLRVVAGESDQSWWNKELAEYTGFGLAASLVAGGEDPWQTELRAENALRAALELEPRDALAAQGRRYVLAETDSPRARHWARLLALRRSAAEKAAVAVVTAAPAEAGATRVATEVQAESFGASQALPRCPGPFGGTTVIVLPASAAPQEVRAWRSLEQNDPLNKDSRFHRLRVASDEDGQRLPDVLQTLRSEGRENVLVVPAAFCADAGTMQALARSVRALENVMTIHWAPGLGNRNVVSDAPKPGTTTAPAVTERTPVFHRLTVVLHPEEHRLTVEDTIELPRALTRAGLEFTLDAALEIRSCAPPAMLAARQNTPEEKRYVLQAAPPDGIVRIEYGGLLNYGLSDQKEEYTRGFRETRGILGPDGVYLHGGSKWVPAFDEEMVQFELAVTAPEGWHVISAGNGTSRGEDGRAQWKSGGLVEEIHLVGGPLTVQRDSAGAVEVAVYLHQPDEALARKYLDATARYIEMYRQLIGPYPYGKFALVENFWETGYGMPSFTLLGPQVIRFPFILTSSYPHEILHNWWGNSVFVDTPKGNWCEGLTAYLADHLIQEQQGQGSHYRRSTLQKYRDYVKAGRDFPLAEFRARHSAATEAVGYGKSLMLFHMLRRQIGDDKFRAGLAGLYRAQRGKRASFADLEAAFEQAAGADLGAFFRQWTTRPGAPELKLENVTVESAAGQFKIGGWLKQVQPAEPFGLQVPLYVQTAAGLKVFDLATSEKDHRFDVTVDSQPLAVAADPMFDVFRILSPLETPPSIGQIFGEPEILAVLPTSSDGDLPADAYRALVESWKSDEHHIKIVTDNELQSLPQDSAAWILGRNNRFASECLTEGLAVALDADPATITLASEKVPLAAHSTVVVRRHPANLDKAIGWITVDPPAAAAGLVRKLPHYGKYSYLAFEGDEPTNVVKGQWDTSNSPMVVHLPQGEARPPAPAFSETRQALAELPPVFSRQALMEHVHWLAAPERGGRGLGTPELAAAAEYIRQRFEAAGLQPGGDDGTWFQRFTVPGPDGRPLEAANVIGLLPGQNAKWADQSVILSAHYDHLGRGWPDVHAEHQGQVHPGADDNASGVAVMLELARDFAAAKQNARNLVVIAFSAEECGRAGSKHYVQHPRFPLAGIRGVINLDTVGRLFDGKLAIHGTGTADEWQHIFRGCGFVTGVKSQNVAGAAEGSDQASFIEAGIPGVQIFTGAHGDYHRPSDTPDKVDGAGLVQVATFLKEALTYLLEREEPLTVRIAAPVAAAAGSSAKSGAAPAGGTAGAEGSAAAAKPSTAPAAAAGDGGRKVLFGVVPDFDFRDGGVRVASLVPDSPAARAGLREGDILVRLDEEGIADLAAFSRLLRALRPGQEVQATVSRDGERISFKIVVQER